MKKSLEDKIHEAAIAFCALCEKDARLTSLVDRYEMDTNSLSDAEFLEMCNRMERIHQNRFVARMVVHDIDEEDW